TTAREPPDENHSCRPPLITVRRTVPHRAEERRPSVPLPARRHRRMSDTDEHDAPSDGHRRRSVLKAGAAGAVAVAAASGGTTSAVAAPADVAPALPDPAPTTEVALRINGEE